MYVAWISVQNFSIEVSVFLFLFQNSKKTTPKQTRKTMTKAIKKGLVGAAKESCTEWGRVVVYHLTRNS